MESSVVQRRPRLITDPKQAGEIALRLGEAVVQSYMREHGCSRSAALRAIHDAGQIGREHSGVMSDRSR